MCQDRIAQAAQSNANFQNPAFFRNPAVRQQIVTQARGQYFDPQAINAAGAPQSQPAVPTPAPSTPVPNAQNTATGLPNLASLMQQSGRAGAQGFAALPQNVQGMLTTLPMR